MNGGPGGLLGKAAMSWTDERVETLKRMWADGQSASAIAKELGGVTRNAVIGKVHRLGLSNRVEEAEIAPEAPAAPERAAPAAPRPVPAAEPEPAEAAAEPEPAAEAPARAVAFTPTPRRPIVPAGQPLPPQPSANEISPEALASVREVEKTRPQADPDGADRADLQMAHRRPRHRKVLVLRPAQQARQTLLRGPCRRRLPAHELAPRPSPLRPQFWSASEARNRLTRAT